MTTAQPLPTLYSARFLSILGLQFVFGLGFSSFLLLPKYLAVVHGAGADGIGRVMAAAPVAVVLLMPIQAYGIDRYLRPRVMLVASLTLAFAAFGFSAVDALGPLVYVLRMFQGAAFAAFFAAGATLVVEIAPRERMGQALGLSGASNLVTNAIGPAVAEPLALQLGWDAVFWLSALCAVCAALGSLTLRDGRGERPASPRRAALLSPRRLVIIYAALIGGLGFGTVTTFSQPFALSVGINEVRGLFIGYTAAALAVRVLFGTWLDRFSRHRVALVTSIVYSLVVLATAGLRPGWLFPIGVALGLAQGALYPVLTALLIESAEPETRGALMTYSGGAFNLGVVFSTLGLGAVAAELGYRGLFVLASLVTATAVPPLGIALARRAA